MELRSRHFCPITRSCRGKNVALFSSEKITTHSFFRPNKWKKVLQHRQLFSNETRKALTVLFGPSHCRANAEDEHSSCPLIESAGLSWQNAVCPTFPDVISICSIKFMWQLVSNSRWYIYIHIYSSTSALYLSVGSTLVTRIQLTSSHCKNGEKLALVPFHFFFGTFMNLSYINFLYWNRRNPVSQRPLK